MQEHGRLVRLWNILEDHKHQIFKQLVVEMEGSDAPTFAPVLTSSKLSSSTLGHEETQHPKFLDGLQCCSDNRVDILCEW